MTVLNPDQGVFTLTRGFSYFRATEPVITAVSPNQGPATGGTEITLSGARFAKGAVVTIGGLPVTNLHWVSETTMQMITPPGSTGWREVRLINPNGGYAA